MPEFLLALYVAVGALSTAPFALYFREADRDKRRRNGYNEPDSPLYLGFLGWIASLVWPVTSLIFGVAWAMTKSDRAEAKAKERLTTLDGARELIHREEVRQDRERERARHTERLRVAQEKADFDRQLKELDGKAPHPFEKPSWQAHVRDTSRRNKLYPFDD